MKMDVMHTVQPIVDIMPTIRGSNKDDAGVSTCTVFGGVEIASIVVSPVSPMRTKVNTRSLPFANSSWVARAPPDLLFSLCLPHT
eukprot:COSAG02_NODE_30338_length_553_cov_0.834802_1_plen_84_part_10